MMVPRSLQLATLLLAVCVFGAAVGGFAENSQLRSKRSTKWCGRNLVDALRLLCNGVYQQMFTNKKRSILIAEDVEEDMAQEQLPTDPFRGWLFPEETHLESRDVRVKRGVFDECCRKSCTVEVLQTYCAN